MRGGYYGIIGKHWISRFQLWLLLLFRRNTMNYSKKTLAMLCSNKRKLAAIASFFTDQSVFCDLQEFFLLNFWILKLTSCTCDLNTDVKHNVFWNNCSLLYFGRFLAENTLSINLKVHFPRWHVEHHIILAVMNHSDLMYSRQKNHLRTWDKSCKETHI